MNHKISKSVSSSKESVRFKKPSKTTMKVPIPTTYINKVQHSPTIQCYYECTLHRTDGPAVIDLQKNIEKWYKHGVLHRDGGPAVTNPVGDFWLQNDVYHRTDGPAVVLKSGRQEWYQHGKLHREGGPAVIDPEKGNEFWIDGVKQEQ
jgi:hypothetical protein